MGIWAHGPAMRGVAAALVCAAAGALGDAGLQDHPIQASGPRSSLDGEGWTAASDTLKLSIAATVPGDVITDLQRAAVIPDPYLDLTWLQNSSLWTSNPWRYTTHFDLPSFTSTSAARARTADGSTVLLVFDGVKMGATVRVNGQVVGVVRDQFLRYVFPLPAASVKPSNNTLEVYFGVGDVAEDGRFMACTGGWDWAPYSYTSTNSSNATSGPANTFSKGIWKSVYLVSVPAATAAITHLTPHTRYTGGYPVTPLVDGAHGGFVVNATTHLWAPSSGASGTLTVTGSWGAGTPTGPAEGAGAAVATATLTLPPGDTAVSLFLNATAEQVKLWWPSGLGAQTLYNVTATWTPSSPTPTASATTAAASPSAAAVPAVATRAIGFRVFALVTVNDTDPAYVAANASADGSGKHGMFFRINGAALYSRGANMVPMEELEGRMDAEAHRILVASSAAAGMNTLRVWGGGIFYPTAFYDACDEHGVLVYHDMQYASTGGGTHGPIATATQEAELRHQIRRLSHHPAIVLWDGCNEVVVNPQPNASSYVFAAFVMTVVAEEDQSRAVWPSSPASGWATGVNRLYQTPTFPAAGLSTFGGGHIWNMGIETHGPYQLGSGWPTVNGGVRDGCFDNAGTGNGVSVPNAFKPGGPGGVGFRNSYASEFGTGGASSFESMSGTLSPSHWGLHGGAAPDTCQGPDQCLGEHVCVGDNPMTQRSYGCDGQIREYWGNNTQVDLAATGAAAFKGQLYQCQMVQAFVLKQVYEARRAQNQFGHLVWMLNEIWPTVGWGSLEYGPPAGHTPGQLRGGRWKPLHYFYKASLMADVMATCGANSVCYLSNHRASRGFNGTVTLTAYDHFGDGVGKVLLSQSMEAAPGPGAMTWFGLPGGAMLPPPNLTSVVATVTEAGTGATLSRHMIQLARPRDIRVPTATLSVAVAPAANPDGSINISVTSDKVALWVTLTSAAEGRFSDNAFLLPATTRVVQFVPFSPTTAAADHGLLSSTLRVEDYSMYKSLPPAPPPPSPPPPPPSPPAPPGAVCDPSLFLQNTNYKDGQGLGSSVAGSALDCCLLCANATNKARGCNHFTFVSGNQCWLKTNGNGKRSTPGAISGAVTGPGR